MGDRGLLAVLVKPCGLTTDLVQSLLSSQDLVFKNLLKIGVVNFDYTTHKSLKTRSPIYNENYNVSLSLSLSPSLPPSLPLSLSLPPSLPPSLSLFLSQNLLKKLAIYSLVISDHSMPVTPLEQKRECRE